MRGIELAEKIKKGQFKIGSFAEPRQASNRLADVGFARGWRVQQRIE